MGWGIGLLKGEYQKEAEPVTVRWRKVGPRHNSEWGQTFDRLFQTSSQKRKRVGSTLTEARRRVKAGRWWLRGDLQ